MQPIAKLSAIGSKTFYLLSKSDFFQNTWNYLKNIRSYFGEFAFYHIWNYEFLIPFWLFLRYCKITNIDVSIHKNTKKHLHTLEQIFFFYMHSVQVFVLSPECVCISQTRTKPTNIFKECTRKKNESDGKYEMYSNYNDTFVYSQIVCSSNQKIVARIAIRLIPIYFMHLIDIHLRSAAPIHP